MSLLLVLTVRFLDDCCHGLLDRGGPPEWPPSPFRLFQALVAGVARRGELVFEDDLPSNIDFTPIGKALGWLQRHTRDNPPIIVAPKSKTGQAITHFVPNNDGDRKFNRQERLTAKPTLPTVFVLEGDQKPEVHYVWDIGGTNDCPTADIERAARSLTTLGWGIDMAFANARLADEAELQTLEGVRWYPKMRDWPFSETLRVPTYDDNSGECTLCDLRHCHSTFINRIEHGKPLKTVEKPKVFDRVLYTSTERPIGRPSAVFRLLDANEDAYRYPHDRLIHVAGMTRHAAIEIVKNDLPPTSWIRDPAGWLQTFVCGHRGDAEQHRQLSYVPLPSIGYEHADALIRNIMIVAPVGCERELDYVTTRLDGAELQPESQVRSADLDTPRPMAGTAYLERFEPPRKFIATHYLEKSKTWRTVTPVVLPGHDDKRAEKTEKLIRKALQQSGVETPCRFEWQSFAFLKNCLSAHKYDRDGRHTGYHRPAHLRDLTAVHLRLTFDSPVRGPVIVGAGRHCGLGLFACE